MSSKKKKKKKKKIRRSSFDVEEMTNGQNVVVVEEEIQTFPEERQQQLQQQQPHLLNDIDQADYRSSPKKKKKKKKEKRNRLLVPEIMAKSPKPEPPRIGKIVILNGTKITSPPMSPLNVTVKSVTSTATSSAASSPKTASPLPTLRSSSPKFCPENDVDDNSVLTLTAAPEPPVSSSIEVIKRRKRKLSADSAVKKTLTTGKRQRIVSDVKENNATPLATSSTTAPISKIYSDPKLKEERISKNGVAAATLVAPTNGRKRESFNGYPSIVLSDNLKRHLSSDFEMVTKKRRLNILPAEPSIVNVLEDFVRHYAAGRLVAFEKHQRKSLYTAHKKENGEMTYQRALEAIQVNTTH
jgi:hypothetical protein